MADKHPENIDGFIDKLPDPDGARVFLNRLEVVDPVRFARSKKDPLLLSRLLTLAGHSPFLAETILRHTEYIDWLKTETERDFDRVKSTEQLSEELARFVTRTIDADDATRLARFKRRELTRIYLRDCLGVATLSEITEELSNLADVILRYGLARANQEMINLHGAPLTHDERGRIEKAEFAIVALGKLGCRELNYASDIDLLFLFAGNGETAGSGRGRQSVISNKQFFTGVAERVTRLIGRSSSEGAVYRIDLRLRPYGRDGEMVCELERARDYYREHAHNWERQALIRARASAGSEQVVTQFLFIVRDVIFTRETLPDTLEDVRRAKEQIDRKEAARMRGFNVKLGTGGIREIEFIAQALQLKHGGREPWVRSAQTLIVLARLAEKQYLTEPERTSLSAAYTFLRIAEHRLQMEHGAQTHTLPASREKLELLAKRCGYIQVSDPTTYFARDLERHTTAVHAIYERVFEQKWQIPSTESPAPRSTELAESETDRLIRQAVARLSKVMVRGQIEADHFLRDEAAVERVLASTLHFAINPSRALRHLAAWAESLGTYGPEHLLPNRWSVGAADWSTLIERLIVVLSSQYLSHLLVSRPLLANALIEDQTERSTADFIRTLRTTVAEEPDASAKPDALRRAWYRLVIGIGYRDMSAVCPEPAIATRDDDNLRAINRAQTALAEAVLTLAGELAIGSMGISTSEATSFPFAILGLGRLGHAGMDYGSDLDLLIVFDDAQPWPPRQLTELVNRTGLEVNTAQEFYARLTSQVLRVLSSITREGLLYRTDLRLRPEGKSGQIAIGLGALVAYITSRASAWEHSAYLKAREIAGDLKFGECARTSICKASFDAASGNEFLRRELREMRMKQVKEKVRTGRPDIKWGPGGMTDVYFVTRYLQLRDRIYFPPEHGTTALIARLGELGVLDGESANSLFQGYSFLRRLDHWMRLLTDRPSALLPASAVTLEDISRALGLSSVGVFQSELAGHTSAIREVFDRVFE